MAGGIDLWGCMIIVFVIVAGMVVVIKILLEFPGLLQWKCVYSEHEHEERVPSGPAYLRRDLELGSRYKSPRASKHSLHKSNSRVMETEMMEMGSKSSQVHWSRASDQNNFNHHNNESNHHNNVNNHHHNESNRIEREHEKSRHHDRGIHNGRAGLKSSKETVVIEAEVVTSSSTTSKTRQMNIDPSSPGIARQC